MISSTKTLECSRIPLPSGGDIGGFGQLAGRTIRGHGVVTRSRRKFALAVL
jgi:hypothetical protein